MKCIKCVFERGVREDVLSEVYSVCVFERGVDEDVFSEVYSVCVRRGCVLCDWLGVRRFINGCQGLGRDK